MVIFCSKAKIKPIGRASDFPTISSKWRFFSGSPLEHWDWTTVDIFACLARKLNIWKAIFSSF